MWEESPYYNLTSQLPCLIVCKEEATGTFRFLQIKLMKESQAERALEA